MLIQSRGSHGGSRCEARAEALYATTGVRLPSDSIGVQVNSHTPPLPPLILSPQSKHSPLPPNALLGSSVASDLLFLWHSRSNFLFAKFGWWPDLQITTQIFFFLRHLNWDFSRRGFHSCFDKKKQKKKKHENP